MSEVIRPSIDQRKTPERKGIPHNCGIAGVYAPGKDVIGIMVDVLSHLNHRGQEGAGIFGKSLDGRSKLVKGDGLVKSVFTEEKIDELKSINPAIASGQDRYSTSGDRNATQPFVDKETGFALSHNGNLTNARQLLEQLPEEDRKKAASDSWIAHQTIINADGENWEEKIANGLDRMEGAFSLVMQAGDKLYAARDPHGMRPLVLGEIPGGGYIVASETSAFTPSKIKYVRGLKRGERIVIDADGVKTFSVDSRVEEVPEKKCIFENIYVDAPDSFEGEKAISEIRYEIGRSLARQDADAGFYPERVVGIQESGVLYTQGYYEEITRQIRRFPEKFGLEKDETDNVLDDIRMVTGFVQNKYAVNGKRIFMEPDAHGRGKATFDKHRVNPFDIEGKRVAIVDDSIVRGTTSVRLVESAVDVGRQTYGLSGPSEIHLRIGSEKIIAPCFWGVDFATTGELAVGKFSNPSKTHEEMNEDIRTATGANSLKYAKAEDVVKASIKGGLIKLDGNGDVYTKNGFCGHCFTGIRPAEVKGVFAKPEISNGNGRLEEGKEIVLSGQYVVLNMSEAGQFASVELE